MQAIKRHRLEDMLFLDIETVRCQKNYPKGELKDSWEYKMRNEPESTDLVLMWKDKASLYAEFNKVVCISLGKIKGGELVSKSYYGDDEKEILHSFDKDLRAFHQANSRTVLVGHSLKGFDNPTLLRRCLVNKVPLNPFFDTAHLKPWEINFVLDLAELWKAGGFYPASLINIAVALGIPHSKSNIDGSEVSEAYYNGKIEEIKNYCEGDIRVAYEITKCLHSN